MAAVGVGRGGRARPVFRHLQDHLSRLPVSTSVPCRRPSGAGDDTAWRAGRETGVRRSGDPTGIRSDRWRGVSVPVCGLPGPATLRTAGQLGSADDDRHGGRSWSSSGSCRRWASAVRRWRRCWPTRTAAPAACWRAGSRSSAATTPVDIDYVALGLVTRVEVESGDSEYDTTQEFHRQQVDRRVPAGAGAALRHPVPLRRAVGDAGHRAVRAAPARHDDGPAHRAGGRPRGRQG